jgi:hypothetical protein
VRRVFLLALLITSAVACSPIAPSVPAAPVSIVARARIAIGASSRAPEGAPPIVVAATNVDAELWRARLQAPALARALEAALGAPVLTSDVDLSEAGNEWTIRVKGDGLQSALARCSTLVRILSHPLETERSAALGWLDAERARTLGSLRALERSLHVLPPEVAGRDLPRGWDEALIEARVHALEARVEDPRSPSLAQPAALRRMLVEAMTEAAQLEVDLGQRHPESVRAAAIVEALYARTEGQFVIERRAAEEWRSKLEARAKLRRGDVRHALREMLRDRLSSREFGPDSVASSDPLSLRLLAIERAAEESAIAALGTRYGARHPERLLAAERLARLDARFETERKSILLAIENDLYMLDEIGRRLAGQSVAVAVAAAGPHAADPSGFDDRAGARSEALLALAATLERIAWWEEALGSPAPARVVSTCAITR